MQVSQDDDPRQILNNPSSVITSFLSSASKGTLWSRNLKEHRRLREVSYSEAEEYREWISDYNFGDVKFRNFLLSSCVYSPRTQLSVVVHTAHN